MTMHKAITVTHILFSIFGGMVVGAVIKGKSSFLILSVILLVTDIVVGITLQYLVSKRK